MRTNKEIKLDGQYAGLTLPKGTRVVPRKGKYWVAEFKWIEDQTGFKDSLYKHDAVHYGITIDPEDVEG